MNQDNATRLKEEFRFAVKGARCRTAGFINPHLAALGQSEWMEAECANGRDWDIKTLKATPGEAPGDELMVEQHYLPAYRGLSFGAAVLELAEYQRAQSALGLLTDDDDIAAQAGAPHFREVAERAGIVFNAEGDPVAPDHGLVTQPGRYPISALKKAYDFEQERPRESMPETLQGRSLQTLPPTTPHSEHYIRQVLLGRVTGVLNELIRDHKEKAASEALSDHYDGLPVPYLPEYFMFAKSFDKRMARLRSKEFSEFTQLTAGLDHFTFHTFRLSAAWILHNISRGAHYSNREKAQEALQDAIKRCQGAAELIQPGIKLDMSDLLDFSKARKSRQYRGITQTELDDSALQDVIEALKLPPRSPCLPLTPPGPE